MSLSPEQRSLLERLLADELRAARTEADASDEEFSAEIERRLSTVAEPEPGETTEPA